MNQSVPIRPDARDPSPFRPVGEAAALLVARAMSGTGDLGVALVAVLRDHGGSLTLAEIRASYRGPVGRADLTRTLSALELSGLVHRRDLVTDAGCEPVWWAPRVPFAMPWTEAQARDRIGGGA